MGLCRDYSGSDGGVHLVHGSDNFVEVRVPTLGVTALSSFIYFRSRTRFRREANIADNKAATVAVDSLINFEAVKVGPPSTLLTRFSYYTLPSTSTTKNTRSHNMISI
jgi:ABC-type transport system involved in Fe-S cluster assembly fused permease/ATPase subunit